jgi:hypothetical protein
MRQGGSFIPYHTRFFRARRFFFPYLMPCLFSLSFSYIAVRHCARSAGLCALKISDLFCGRLNFCFVYFYFYL